MSATSGTLQRLAYFSPLPPARSGVADYSAELLPHLAERVDLAIFVDDPALVDRSIADTFTVRPLQDYPALRHDFDLALYQIGNSRLHAQIYDMALRYPGVIVLHDYVLHHFIGERTTGQGDFPGYARELAYNLEGEGVQLAEEIRRGWSTPPGSMAPLSKRIVDVSIATLVHSGYIFDKLSGNSQQIYKVPALITPLAAHSHRDELQLPKDAIVFGAFGQITPNRQMPELFQAFAELQKELPQAQLLLVGESQQIDLGELAANAGVKQGLHLAGFVPELADFVGWIHTADVVVNLRNPTMGETSAIALRAMAACKPLIVNDHGWYAELPSEAVLKVPVGDPLALLSAMRKFAFDADLRCAMGASGRGYVDDNCAPERVANAYTALLGEVLGSLMADI